MVNIVDLGLVYGVDVEGERVHVEMTLTTLPCPMYEFMAENVRQKVEAMEGVKEAVAELEWDPPWTPNRMSEETKKKLGVE
ncbi:iron-sulfur cluster assembly protein [Methanolobus sp. ZRKC3]|uniref:metal-sulfur cluster assembly factor n=1 Tax=Methanolobus sp. ZRKC3 TaxID=3125786 RepID=UPI00324A8FBD